MILVTGQIPHARSLINWLGNHVAKTVAYEPSIDTAVKQYPDAQIVMGPAAKRMTDKVVSQWRKLEWYHALSAGVDDLPLKQFQKQGVLLTNSSGIHAIPMSEHILGVILMFSRNLHSYVRNQAEQEWSRDYPRLGEVFGKTLCIVGAGRIGEAVAAKARVFGMNIIGVKRTPGPLEHFNEVVGMDELNRVLPESDYVLLLTPLTKDTYHFFGQQQLNRMKSSAVLLNFARGSVVDEPALITALTENKIGGAGLDVFEKEPLPANHPLWRLSNVILTPHLAGVSGKYNKRAFQVFVENYQAWESGEQLPTQVDLDLGY